MATRPLRYRQALAEYRMDLSDGHGIVFDKRVKDFLNTRGLKSAGGTEQILRNTIGERVLGLPPEPRLDKGVPFSELRSIERDGARA